MLSWNPRELAPGTRAIYLRSSRRVTSATTSLPHFICGFPRFCGRSIRDLLDCRLCVWCVLLATVVFTASPLLMILWAPQTVPTVQSVQAVPAPTSFLPRDAGEDEGRGLNGALAFERFEHFEQHPTVTPLLWRTCR